MPNEQDVTVGANGAGTVGAESGVDEAAAAMRLIDVTGVLLPWEGSETTVGALHVPLGEVVALYVYVTETLGENMRVLLSADPFEPEEGADLSDPNMIDEIEDYIFDDGSIVLVSDRKTAPRVESYVVTHDTLVPIHMLALDVAVGGGAAQIGCNVLSQLCGALWPEYIPKLLAAQQEAASALAPGSGSTPTPTA
jgi:hypothetical protein